MSVPSSVEELFQLIRKSGMIDETKLTAYLQRRQVGRGLPQDPREAADAMIRDGLITYFQAEQFLLGKWRGFTIGKYKLLERVGVGGMGQVFLCEHMFMKRRIAVKVLPPAKADQPAALGRFYREARAAGSLEHPNIVRTHDIDQDGNLHFIVMEYVDGPNLLEVVKKFGPMNIARAVNYANQIAVGLQYAFKAGIIHRDIKPGNVLIDRHGKAKILDLGLARFYNDLTDNLTVKYDDKIVLGTADYVAPEQVANSHTVDVRADIYALGASFYFMLAGHPPFPSGTVSQKLLWHRTKDPTPIRQIRPEVPEGLAAVLAKMMAKEPAQRYQTPAEVAADLAQWEADFVPLPAAEEMPQLSPAASEGAGASTELAEAPMLVAAAAPSGVTESKLIGSIRGSANFSNKSGSNFGAAAGPFAPAPADYAPLTAAVAEPPRPSQPNSSPFRRPDSKPPSRSPFSLSQTEVPTNATSAHDHTPSHQRPVFRPETAPLKTAPASVPLRTVAFVSLVVASAILAAGILFWKFA